MLKALRKTKQRETKEMKKENYYSSFLCYSRESMEEIMAFVNVKQEKPERKALADMFFY